MWRTCSHTKCMPCQQLGKLHWRQNFNRSRCHRHAPWRTQYTTWSYTLQTCQRCGALWVQWRHAYVKLTSLFGAAVYSLYEYSIFDWCWFNILKKLLRGERTTYFFLRVWERPLLVELAQFKYICNRKWHPLIYSLFALASSNQFASFFFCGFGDGVDATLQPPKIFYVYLPPPPLFPAL